MPAASFFSVFSFGSLRRWTVSLLLLAANVAFLAPDASAQASGALTTIRAFNGPTGEYPTQALTLGNDGNFYGVTAAGGANGSGTVFRITPTGVITLLYSFDSSTGGFSPQCKLLLASDGNFYGTTHNGGPRTTSGNTTLYGDGTVFRITPNGVFTVLYTFSSDGVRGREPAAGLVQGSDGALYGTTQYGGIATSSNTSGDGALFRLTLDGVFTLLHTFNFHQTGTGGYTPTSALVQGDDGNFYGVAKGGDNGAGVIYKLTAGGTVSTLYSFNNAADGSNPVGPLAGGGDGAFYGVTVNGAGGYGAFFKITAGGDFTTLHALTYYESVSSSSAGPIQAADGNFYLTSQNGGSGNGGIIQLTPTGVATIVYKFVSSTDGYAPTGALTQAVDGSFFGTTQYGGASSYGTIFRLVINPHPPFFDGQVDLGNGAEYLSFPNGNYFGYYSFLSDPRYIYHFDLGYEYVFDAKDGKSGVYLYDFKSGSFFYTSPTFPFPYLYDFSLNSTLYYYPDPGNAGHYNTNGVRYFYNFSTGRIITK